MYQRIPIKDSEDSDFEPHFEKCLDFLGRVETKKAKVLIHCTAGASRAPTIALAYLVDKIGLSLCDGFNYLRTKRIQVRPNKKFLFNLAELELKQGLGSSVLHHPEWRFYEFNLLKGSVGCEFRESIGLYRTVLHLYTKVRNPDEFLLH